MTPAPSSAVQRCPPPRAFAAIALLPGRQSTDPAHARRHRDPGPLLRDGHLHRLLREGVDQHQRGVLPRRPRDVRLDRRPELRLRQPGLARTHGLGRLRLPVRHSRHPLVLDRRDPRHALPRHRHDALLLHLQRPTPSPATSSFASAKAPADSPPSPSAS